MALRERPDGRPSAAAQLTATATGAGGSLARFGRWALAQRLWLLLAVHLAVFVLVYILAYALRFEGEIPESEWPAVVRTLPWVLAAKVVVFYMARQYSGWWRYVTFGDLVSLVRAALLSLAVLAVINHFVLADYVIDEARQIPRSVLVLDCGLTIAVLGTLRASWRLFREQFHPMLSKVNVRWALMVGTDHASAILAHQIQAYFQLPYRIRGLLSTDDDRRRNGGRMGQLPILGDVDDLTAIAANSNATDVLVTAGALGGPRLRKLMDECRRGKLNLKIIRPTEDRLDGDHTIPIRDIEITDLLRREPVQLDTEGIGRLLEGRRVMVTGAGGSIGSEICRQVLRFNPQSLTLVGRGENRIFTLERELRTARSDTVLETCIADVTDAQRMRQVFERYRPEVVFHAAAHKHVPLMEENVGEAVRNNVLGTKNVAELADEFAAQHFVFISTDKVVHPVSVMGVSKHLAERYVHAMSQESATRFTVVRFGNVLGSNGSVVPIFQDQIRCGGPITVTDPRMTRFFMTIPEASQLVLQAAAMGRGGEIFVLEMGEPVRIVDLARDLVRLSGLPEHAIEIVFTGVRPGEKLYEELYFDDEQTLPTGHPKLRAAYHRPFSLGEVRQTLAELANLVYGPPEALRRRLRELVPEFRPMGEPQPTAPRSDAASEGVKPAA